MKYDWPFRDCEFCGCHTNARIRRCCLKGQMADALPKKVYLVVRADRAGPIEFASWSKAACHAYLKGLFSGDYKVVGPYCIESREE